MAKKEKKTESKTATSESTDSIIRAFRALVVVALGALIGFFVYTTTVTPNSSHPFKLGLDLAGGSHLVYEADVSGIEENDVEDAMNTLRDVIERRVNTFGVSEPIVQVEGSSVVAGERSERLVVELPGVTDVATAVAEIGKTPLLEFKLVDPNYEDPALTGELATGTLANSDERYIDTGLTGRYLERAELVFGQAGGGLSNEPIVLVTFNSEGGDLFEEITTNHVGEYLAIFLDGEVVSEPVIREPIIGGSATISGNFTPEEGRELVRNLNFGALPLPIALASTQTIGASLGAEVLEKGTYAGAIGLVFVALFMLIYYRVPGLVAIIALLIYIASMLALFKLIPVTLTAAGLAGFILSIGMAVDANVLVFERMKEEYQKGTGSREAARAGFARAWSAIRDGNVTSILSAIILFWFGTSIVKGFALVFGMGVLVSMITAIAVTRTLLVALPERSQDDGSLLSKLYTAGFTKETNT